MEAREAGRGSCQGAVAASASWKLPPPRKITAMGPHFSELDLHLSDKIPDIIEEEGACLGS